MGVSNIDEDGGGVDGDGSGGNSPSRLGAGTETFVPQISSNLVREGGSTAELYLEKHRFI
jgi:hypothetical protein